LNHIGEKIEGAIEKVEEKVESVISSIKNEVGTSERLFRDGSMEVEDFYYELQRDVIEGYKMLRQWLLDDINSLKEYEIEERMNLRKELQLLDDKITEQRKLSTDMAHKAIQKIRDNRILRQHYDTASNLPIRSHSSDHRRDISNQEEYIIRTSDIPTDNDDIQKEIEELLNHWKKREGFKPNDTIQGRLSRDSQYETFIKIDKILKEWKDTEKQYKNRKHSLEDINRRDQWFRERLNDVSKEWKQKSAIDIPIFGETLGINREDFGHDTKHKDLMNNLSFIMNKWRVREDKVLYGRKGRDLSNESSDWRIESSQTAPLNLEPEIYKRGLYEDIEKRISDVLFEWRQSESTEMYDRDYIPAEELTRKTLSKSEQKHRNFDLIQKAHNLLEDWKKKEEKYYFNLQKNSMQPDGILREKDEIKREGLALRRRFGELMCEWRERQGKDTSRLISREDEELSRKIAKSESIRSKLFEAFEKWEERENMILSQKSSADIIIKLEKEKATFRSKFLKKDESISKRRWD